MVRVTGNRTVSGESNPIPPAQAASSPDGEAGVCPQCGTRLGADALFCPRCGAAIPEGGAPAAGEPLDAALTEEEATTDAGFDIEAFVHTSGEGFGGGRQQPSPDAGDIDLDALSSLAGSPKPKGRKLTRRERKAAKKELKRLAKEAKKADREAKRRYASVKSQLKDRDKELSAKTEGFRRRRERAKTVVEYIGYNKMFQDGICEVEEGLFSASIAFDDTSYHSVRDEQQKAMFSAMCRLYDSFGADTLVQMSVVNTPLLKEEVGSRQFFDVNRQDNDAARHDAAVFNDILNDKLREGVSNIRRSRYLTYSVTADTADDAARKLSRIETECSRLLNSMGSKAHLMNGTQRLAVIHSLLNPFKPFYFDYQRDISARSAQTTKDCIAPGQIDFKPDGVYNDCVKLDNGVYAQVLVMKSSVRSYRTAPWRTSWTCPSPWRSRGTCSPWKSRRPSTSCAPARRGLTRKSSRSSAAP